MNWADCGYLVTGILAGVVLSCVFILISKVVDNIHNTVSEVHSLVSHVSEQQHGISNQIHESTKKLADRIHAVEKIVREPVPEVVQAPPDVGVENRVI